MNAHKRLVLAILPFLIGLVILLCIGNITIEAMHFTAGTYPLSHIMLFATLQSIIFFYSGVEIGILASMHASSKKKKHLNPPNYGTISSEHA